jgi:hypothetical protein
MSTNTISLRQVRPPHELKQIHPGFPSPVSSGIRFIFVPVFGALEIKAGWLVRWYSIIQGLHLPLSTELRHDIVLYKTRNTIAARSIKVTKSDSKAEGKGNWRHLVDNTENRRQW